MIEDDEPFGLNLSDLRDGVVDMAKGLVDGGLWDGEHLTRLAEYAMRF